MTTIINAVSGSGLTQTADGSGIVKLQSNGTTTNALAWVNFNGTTATRNAYYNVSSVTRNGAGDYTVNFTNALSDANYAVAGMGNGAATNDVRTFVSLSASARDGTPTIKTTTAVQIITGSTAVAPNLFDNNNMSIVIFGN